MYLSHIISTYQSKTNGKRKGTPSLLYRDFDRVAMIKCERKLQIKWIFNEYNNECQRCQTHAKTNTHLCMLCILHSYPYVDRSIEQIRVENLKMCVSSNINQPIFHQSLGNITNSLVNVNKMYIYNLLSTRKLSTRARTLHQMARNTEREGDEERVWNALKSRFFGFCLAVAKHIQSNQECTHCVSHTRNPQYLSWYERRIIYPLRKV